MAASRNAVAGAIELTAYGPPEVLTYRSVSLPALAAREVRIKTLAAAVNHTDLEIRAGNWPIRKPNPFPYVPGVEVVGIVEEIGNAVHGCSVGQRVITMMQGLGGIRAERTGGYADYVTVDADAVASIPAHLDPISIAAFGLVGVTAYWGLAKIGSLAGKRVLVTGAAGAVGSAAVAIAHAQGASVVAAVRRAEQAIRARELGANEVIVGTNAREWRSAQDGVDGVIDPVGGNQFRDHVGALRANGVLSLVGAAAGSEVSFDAWRLIRPITLTGYSTEDLDGGSLRLAIDALSEWIASGAVRAPDHHVMNIVDAARAHRLIEEKRIAGRVLLVPQGAS